MMHSNNDLSAQECEKCISFQKQYLENYKNFYRLSEVEMLEENGDLKTAIYYQLFLCK